ncbi:pyridoxamine 5'-phosphate oxidase family protein [Pannonibacter sp. I15F10I1]|uniref:pyridoxamine 5'-phosphate oxidase family protein n=1 Tax=Pannonibacter sp. I15F10I1 TaxID=2003580 RepID=UPI001645DCC4|nr:pyridoxamine 5'-phosphate oxidase family protein [Pannonibacter sp. I15F10I1]
MSIITSIDDLEKLYGTAGPASTVKESPRITPEYRRLIEAAPFCALATSGPEGLDCSPRGDKGSCVIIENDTTLLMPDRRGNNRIDSLRNVVRDPRVALMFLIPGHGNALRVNGRAVVSIDEALLTRLEMEGKRPRSVLVISIETIYFQCARAIIRAGLWDAAAHVDSSTLPTPGQILASLSDGSVGGEAYDKEWPERARTSMW